MHKPTVLLPPALVAAATLLLLFTCFPPALSAQETYKLPPDQVVQIIDAPPPPLVLISPCRDALLLVERKLYPPIGMLARPFLRLAGLRIDPARFSSRRLTLHSGLCIRKVVGDETIRVQVPPGSNLDNFSWSPDGRRLAFTRDSDSGVELWVADPSTGRARVLPGFQVSDILDRPFSWTADSRQLLVRLAIGKSQPPPPDPLVPAGPVVEETAGKFARLRTYQDLLANPHDQDLFEYYAGVQLARVEISTGSITRLGRPGLIMAAEYSPDGKYLLITRLRRPFSYRVPYYYFTRSVEVWDSGGTLQKTIADLPVSDQVPSQGVPTGPREVAWQPLVPAALIWVEALDDGDPLKKVPHRDRLMTQVAPFSTAPRELLRITHRFSDLDWTARPNLVLLTEYDRDRRWITTYILDLSDAEATRRTLFDLSSRDDYNAPGSPLYETRPDGQRVMLQDGDLVYFRGTGASNEGDRPFLDRLNLVTLEKKRIFHCPIGSYEQPITFRGDSRSAIITRRESPLDPPNYFLLELTEMKRNPLSDYKDPAPDMQGVTRELIRYHRADGVPLTGTLYLPPGYRKGERLPLVIWAYPMEYSDASTAGQVRGSPHTFPRFFGTSALFFLTRGYAVLYDAAMPVVGDAETMNNTFVEQIVGAAQAAIDKLDAMGVIDPGRVLVGGHSYGAFMSANLLAHSDLFAAGIARSGAYNRSLTPFGFQSERRSFWEAPDTYLKVSPFAYADRIKAPLLLIHGQADENSGTYPEQSEQFFQAIQGNGGTARLVLLPFEGHSYMARESVLQVIAEMFEWADRHLAGGKGNR